MILMRVRKTAFHSTIPHLAPEPMTVQKCIYILYGSQTGNAESIAQDLHAKCVECGVETRVEPLNAVKKADFVAEASFLAIVVSTTGNGDAPENADAWWRAVKLRSCSKEKFQGVPFSVLGLGDTNYDKFCYMGKSIDKRMVELGASRAVDLHCADEATNLHDVVEEWKVKILEVLTQVAKSASEGISGESNIVDSVFKLALDVEKISVAEKKAPLSPFPAGLMTIVQVSEWLGMLDKITGGAPDESQLPRLKAVGSSSQELLYDASSSAGRKISDVGWTLEHPYECDVLSAQYLTRAHKVEPEVPWEEQRRVVSASLLLGQSGIAYQPGDAVGIVAPNRDEVVAYVLARMQAAEPGLALRPDMLLRAKSDASVSVLELLMYKIDLTAAPKKADVMLLSTYCTDASEAAAMQWLCSKGEEGKALWAQFIEAQGLGLAELLHLCTSCHVPLCALYQFPGLDRMCPMLPRYYSISSSPLAHGSKLSIAFSVVQKTNKISAPHATSVSVSAPLILRSGLCTAYLEQSLQPLLRGDSNVEVKLRIFHKPSVHFKLPGSSALPLVLIGPGTGVAPFVGFLEHRLMLEEARCASDLTCSGVWRGSFELGENDLPVEGTRVKDFVQSLKPGSVALYFGCRDTNDFLYEDALQARLREGVLSRLEVAMSRVTQEKVYVQHLLRQQGRMLASSILQDGAYVYICGDGTAMARDVTKAIKQALVEHGPLSEAQADEVINDMKQRRRFVLDIWS